ncbi:hypothetical protein [Metabacillus indicus]|uniref:hypothetical protein n=1 Tax=Metabacillus indicus TaxID=246786 RepID=UPI00248FABA5|nr:hypothetical protein [Metabacillus indicus]
MFAVGVYIKNLVINEITGGTVNFGNCIRMSSNEASKTVQDSEQPSEENETASDQMPRLQFRLFF